MADWQSNDDLTEPNDGYDAPIMGVTGGDRARPGDSYVLSFHDDGEEVDTEEGVRAAFDATLQAADFNPRDGNGDPIEEGDDVRFMTGSARFLAELNDVMPVRGESVKVTVVDTGFDAAYTVEKA